LLARARTSCVMLPDGSIMRQEKFSSMGNGFTFPLETLIFWGLAASCCENNSDASVYGDDIVIPTDKYDLLVEVLQVCGFEVNVGKSYNTGLFRESCGKDYFSGIDVRPTYPRGWVSGQSLFVLHNFYVRQGDFERAQKVLSYIHPALRIYGPDGYGDGHLIGDHPRRLSDNYRQKGYSGYFFDTFVSRTTRDSVPLARGEYVVPLYTIYRRCVEDVQLPSPEGLVCSTDKACLLSKLNRRIEYAPLPLPVNKDGAKELAIPQVSGYKKIKIYTLGVNV